MRKLFILSGVPGSGKSSFIQANGLEPYTLSSDKIRQIFGNPEMDLNGDEHISQHVNKETWKLLYHALEYRMKMGETTVVDATHVTIKSINPYRDLAKKYGYKLHIVKFGRTLTLEEMLRRDQNRSVLNKVGEKVVRKFYERMKTFDSQLSKRYNPITPGEMLDELNWQIRNLSKYDAIKVIGDVHSCATALNKVLEGFSEQIFYIFLGDYFDRGIEPVETMKILQKLLKKPNVAFLMGNHERHLYNFLAGQPVKSSDAKKTLDELLKVYKTKDIYRFVKQLQPVYLATFNDFELLFTHAGVTPGQFGKSLKDYAKRLVLRNESEFVNGCGGYEYPLVDAWKKADLDTNQYYGHRNHQNYPVISDANIFPLEQQVEHGGKLGSVLIEKLDNDAISTSDVSVKNTVFATKEDSFDFNKLREHPMVRVKDLSHGVQVFNFTRDAFFKKAWDTHTLTARGLFVNKQDEIVARGYNKFFNLGERPGTSLNEVAKKIQELANKSENHETSVIITDKENGFLAIVSYIPELGGLKVFSKGAGEFHSELSERIISDFLKEHGSSLEELETKLKQDFENGEHYSLTFEIVSPKYDPHLVEYKFETAYLLDAIENTVSGTLLYEKRDELVKLFNFQVADTKKFTIKDGVSIKFIETLLYSGHNKARKNFEGLVIRFGDDQMIKIKVPWYLIRKKFRTLINTQNLDIESSSYKDYEFLQPIVKEMLKLKSDWVLTDDGSINLPATLAKSDFSDIYNELNNSTFHLFHLLP